MLVDLGSDFADQIVNTDHVVGVKVVVYGHHDERYVDEIEVSLITRNGPRWMRTYEDKSRGFEVLAGLKRRLHVQPADWDSPETSQPIHSGRDGARGSLPSQLDRSTSAESKDAQS